MTDRVYRTQKIYEASNWKYDANDLDPVSTPTHYVETIREVVRPISVQLWTYHENSYDNGFNSLNRDRYYPTTPAMAPSNILSEFLCRTELGVRIAEIGVPVSVEKNYNMDTMTTVHYVIGHFTNDTYREFEKFQMIQKLSGKQY